MFNFKNDSIVSLQDLQKVMEDSFYRKLNKIKIKVQFEFKGGITNGNKGINKRL